jgi:hypothetical protein
MTIDPKVKKLSKRVVWKVFDKPIGSRIVSLFMGATYPKGKLVERSPGNTSWTDSHRLIFRSASGLYFYLTKEIAEQEASTWSDSYIAKFKVSPKDFIFASDDGREAMYERATRVGNFIRVKRVQPL